MAGRDPSEPHRASTPLELLFDLCFVVAVAQAGAQLHGGLVEGRSGPAVIGYLMVFFAIWWAWMNFTWFASAYDTDDVPYRLLTLVQMAGVLILAAGVPATFRDYDFTTITIGYVVMRVALIAQWLRAALEHPDGRPAALRYAGGIAVCQAGWLARLALPHPWSEVGFGVLVLAELAVPAWAERVRTTSWHPSHIAERYGLFTIIVFGEVVLASTTAVQSASTTGGLSPSLLEIATGGLLLIFGLWWAYFKHADEERLRESLRSALLWGYGHYLVFAAGAALGAGLQMTTDTTLHGPHAGARAASFAVAIPVTVYLVVLALLRATNTREDRAALPLVFGTAVLITLTAAVVGPLSLPLSVLVMGLLVALLVAASVTLRDRVRAQRR